MQIVLTDKDNTGQFTVGIAQTAPDEVKPEPSDVARVLLSVALNLLAKKPVLASPTQDQISALGRKGH